MFFTALSDSRALFASSGEQIACCCATLSQGCFLVGMFQVFLMQRRKTQGLEMPVLKTWCGSKIWYLSKSENLVHGGLLFSRLYGSRVICWSALPTAGSFGNIEQQLWTTMKTGLFFKAIKGIHLVLLGTGGFFWSFVVNALSPWKSETIPCKQLSSTNTSCGFVPQAAPYWKTAGDLASYFPPL